MQSLEIECERAAALARAREVIQPAPAMKPPHHESKEGILYAASAYALWGLIPIYWRYLAHVPPFEIVLHRILWCAVTMVVVLAFKDRLKGALSAFRNGRALRIRSEERRVGKECRL